MSTKTTHLCRSARVRDSVELAEKALERLDLSAAELADTLGIERSTVSRWLSGERVMSAAARAALAAMMRAAR
jgi:transcriptional regulator with XRE-family HTH domain